MSLSSATDVGREAARLPVIIGGDSVLIKKRDALNTYPTLTTPDCIRIDCVDEATVAPHNYRPVSTILGLSRRFQVCGIEDSRHIY